MGSAVFSADVPFDALPPPPPPFTEVLKVRKPSNETITNSTSLQNDDDLKLALASNKTYIIDGVLFVSSTKAKPDIKIGFLGQTGSTLVLGYVTDKNVGTLNSGSTSSRIVLPANMPTPIHVKGTIKTGSTAGDLQLKWAQVSSNSAAVQVLEGSYLRAAEI